MARLRDAARQVVAITVAHWALLLLLGTGVLMPPEQRSLLPPSFCIAPPEFYKTVGILDFFFAPAAFGAIALAGFVACHHQVDAAGAGAATKALLRAVTVTAVVLSATAAGIAMAASVLILQVKAGRLACLSGSVRACVYSCFLLAVPILVFCYVDVIRMALF